MFSLEQRMMEWWTSKSSLYLEDHCLYRRLPPVISESRLLTVSHNLRTDAAVSLDSGISCEIRPKTKQGLAEISLIPDSKRSLSCGPMASPDVMTTSKSLQAAEYP